MITPRLKCIIDHTTGARIADIGTDHAYIPIYLIENNIAEHIIAGDIRRGPVEIARANVHNHNLSDRIEVRLGSGLSVFDKGEADTVIIAGMGGVLISEIIDEDIEKTKNCRLVLQPMNAQNELRKYLIGNNFMITDEDIAVEGFKVYNIITAQYGKQEPFKSEIEYHIPKTLKNHKYYKNLYYKKHREFTKIIKGLENSKDIDEEKLNLYKYLLGELEKYESE
ncbi:MAG: class I SAM-dependent methyltransferase [Oscillospiraceae bacterium]|nr:class I SAM-dependent methyltransferase [Oscillospiraceae bacterium]